MLFASLLQIHIKKYIHKDMICWKFTILKLIFNILGKSKYKKVNYLSIISIGTTIDNQDTCIVFKPNCMEISLCSSALLLELKSTTGNNLDYSYRYITNHTKLTCFEHIQSSSSEQIQPF